MTIFRAFPDFRGSLPFMRLLPFFALFAVPLQAGDQIRVATYNASLALTLEGQLPVLLNNSNYTKAKKVAEIIQIIQPDVLLLNEFDYDPGNLALDRFHNNYLNVSQNGRAAQSYPYRYTAPSNTGVHSGFDLDNNGTVDDTKGDVTYGNDAFGFGEFPGKYGMAVYSKFPIQTAAIRTFQTFLWKDMPGNLIPPDYYSAAEQNVIRLSSKSHWDVPIDVNGKTLHFLVSHPTPPVFDGAEDKNGRRNHDEIRLWADYLSAKTSGYLYDDASVSGGLAPLQRFVIAGDQNADPTRGDSVNGAINQLLDHPLVDGSFIPLRPNGSDITSTFNLRVDYVLPSKAGFGNLSRAVFWPTGSADGATLVNTSDHRPVYVDLEILPFIEDAVRDLDISVNGVNVAFTWNTEPGVEYGLETSADLKSWTPDSSTVVLLDAESQSASASIPNSGEPHFIRITARYGP